MSALLETRGLTVESAVSCRLWTFFAIQSPALKFSPVPVRIPIKQTLSKSCGGGFLDGYNAYPYA